MKLLHALGKRDQAETLARIERKLDAIAKFNADASEILASLAVNGEELAFLSSRMLQLIEAQNGDQLGDLDGHELAAKIDSVARLSSAALDEILRLRARFS